mgnify:CR=1 FL=1
MYYRGKRTPVGPLRSTKSRSRAKGADDSVVPATGLALAGIASACIDVSDGLTGDLRKLLEASGVGADLNLDALPLSDAMSAAFDEDVARRFAATGGDDYELCFTSAQSVPPEIAGVPVTAIGTVNEGDRLVCRSAGAIVEVDDSGYRHF